MRIRAVSLVCAIAVSLVSFGCAGNIQSNQPKQSPAPSQPPTTPQSSSVQITTTQLPSATSGSSYSATLVATGGIPPYLWSLASGILPTGLTMSSAGQISGQPTAATHSVITVSVADSSNSPASAQASLAIDVAAAPSQPPTTQTSSLQITTTQLPSATTDAPYSASLAATGGTPPYVWSLNSATLPDGLTLSSAGVISGQPTAASHTILTIDVADSSVVPVTAETSLAIDIAAGTTTATPSTSTLVPAGYYGAQFGADGLANTTVGPNGNTVSYRFSAQHNGALSRLRVYLIPDHVGYAAGTAGKLRIDIQSDDGSSAHNPSGTVLASTVISNPLAATGSARYFPLVTFSSPPTLTAGKLYHIVFRNVDSLPTINYLSVDCLYYEKPTTPTQPTLSDWANAVLLRTSGSSWQPRKGYTPISELYYSNGNTQGIGYIEAFVAGPQIISGTATLRETFTVTGATKKIASVGIRAARASGSSYLKVRLENANGTLIEEGYIPASSFPLTSPVSHTWVEYKFASPHTLQSGQTYHIVLTAPSTSQYVAYTMQKGTAYGFDNTTFFPDGHAELKSGSSWLGWTVWGVTNRVDSDLQFYLGMVQ